MEMDNLHSDEELVDDEETGLTGRDRRKRRRRKRRNTRLDERILGNVEITKGEEKLATQTLLRTSLINCLLIGLWYLFSISISIYNKWMFSPGNLDFHYPLFTTCLHMVVQFTLASLVLFFVPSFRPRHNSVSPHTPATHNAEPIDPKKPLMTKWFYCTRIGPCGAATGLDIGLGNMSLKFISLTFFRVVMMVAGETAFNALGFILIMSSAFFSGFRWSLTQILLLRNPATSNPFSSIFFLAPVMFLSLLIIALPVEGPADLKVGLAGLMEAKGNVLGIGILLFPGALAFFMTASEFALLKRTSVVTLSICGIFKEVVTISAAGIVFHDPLTPINISGLVVTIASIAAYNYIKIQKMRDEAMKEAHLTVEERTYKHK
ncbi:hypothetical protein B0A49_01654 [Cryomyces minteri]|uniref:Sugar phosphate transporter domain-containing protein n=1 Tax=Cryomyces minteri TaxID=331657 RepID=A0A4V5NHG2_9PEZI|nr:hypothetical protein B0A49_01654 [Cryomyces minteri]